MYRSKNMNLLAVYRAEWTIQPMVTPDQCARQRKGRYGSTVPALISWLATNSPCPGSFLVENFRYRRLALGGYGVSVGFQATQDTTLTHLDLGAMGEYVILALSSHVIQCGYRVFQLRSRIVQGVLTLARQLVFVSVETGQESSFALGDLAAVLLDFDRAALLHIAHDVLGGGVASKSEKSRYGQ
jgi:hypothetical protein